MGNFLGTEKEEPPPPVVLVPPLFDFPPLAARTRMLEPSYDLLFGKLALRCLFEDYFEQAGQFSTKLMLKPIDDPHVDLVATVSGPLDRKSQEKIVGNALFRWQRNLDDPHTFMDLFVSNSDPALRLRSCAYYPQYGVGAFSSFPLMLRKRIHSEDYGFMGLRYGSEKLSIGTTMVPLPLAAEFPRSAWVVAKFGMLNVGMQYKPHVYNKQVEADVASRFKDLKNYSWAIGYGSGTSSPLTPSFNFGLELANTSKLIASFYQHVVVQRRVKNPLEGDDIVGITNYIDVGFELETRADGSELSKSTEDSTFRVGASWQTNKNFLVKGKLGPRGSSIALAFKSWWKPSLSFSITAVRDRVSGKTALGVNFGIEDLREASYQRADPNYIMLTPNKEHLAESIIKHIGVRPMFKSDIDSGNFDNLPRDLKPMGKIL
ncbi:uncharacterized protein [Aristolochia californica]|uniref:uncharacterized protein isoform X2 n=1 Tax=Aristolochia californica TaxID=171875 RepID=UPI0035DEA0D4